MDNQTLAVISWRDPATGDNAEVQVQLPATFGRSRENDVVLSSGVISRHHARLEMSDGQLTLLDLGSANGTFLNGERIQDAQVTIGDSWSMGPFDLSLQEIKSPSSKQPPTVEEGQPSESDDEGTVILKRPLDTRSATQRETLARPSENMPRSPSGRVPFPPLIFNSDQVSISDLKRTGLPVDETTYLALGGGLGSFIWVDHLVIYGADPSAIVAIGFEPKPYGRYRRLCLNSQIPDHERLRSDSGSTPDNIWGWPGYAVREIADSLRSGNIGQAVRIGWQIFGEPTLSETYTPIAGRLFRSIDREAERISWGKIFRVGRIRAIRKTTDSRYAVAYSQTLEDGSTQHRFIIGQYVQLALGYPGIKLLPDLEKYRETTSDLKNVANAYENHEYIYTKLQESGGRVVVRGRGIVASRIIQRLYELRKAGADVKVLHLMRSPLRIGHLYKRTQRRVDQHWELQPFNWPKAAFGGSFCNLLLTSDETTRTELLNDWGGTTTADRRDWRKMISNGLRDGWYELTFGEVSEVIRHEDGSIATFIRGKSNRLQSTLISDFVIDATGLDADLERNPLLKDLVTRYKLERNVKGRLAVTPYFELAQMQNNQGRMYATGAMTFGSYFAPVDSFLGLQYSVQRIMDKLLEGRAPGLKPLTSLRSIRQWLQWAKGLKP